MNDSDKNDQKCYEVNSWDYAWVPTFCKKKNLIIKKLMMENG